MRRIGEQTPATKPLEPERSRNSLARFRRGFAGISTAMFLVASTTAVAAIGDDPELAPPSEMPVVSKPAKPARPPVTAPGARAVLAVPGLTTPSTRPPTAAIPAPSASSLEPSSADLGLEAPIEMRGGSSPAPRALSPNSSRSPRPIELESSPLAEPIPMDGPTTGPKPSTRRPSTNSRNVPQAAPAPARRGRFFGLLPGPVVPSPMNARSTAPGRSNAIGRSEVGEPREDLAAESALKRRIDKQAHEVVGDRARSIEVRLQGKSATVVVRGVKFYQKRGVRKSLETIPALTGLSATIEVLD